MFPHVHSIVSTTFIVAGVLLVAVGCRGVHRRHHGHHNPKRLERHIARKLDLSPTQREELRKLIETIHNSRSEMHSIKGKVKPEIMKQLRAERIDKIALKNLFSEQKPILHRHMEKVFDAFNEFNLEN